jgi:Flp pilus assembly protein TadD
VSRPRRRRRSASRAEIPRGERGRGGGGRRALRVAAVTGLLVATAGVYLPVGGFGYVSYDDPEYVAESPQVLGGLTPDGVGQAFVGVHHGNWHPLTTLSYMLEVEVFGAAPGVQHRVNGALHLLNTLLLLALLARATGAFWRSLAVAALFAVHPLHVESVAWIAQRKDVLSTAFGLASALAWVGYARAPGRGRYAAVAALLTAGLLAKAMLVTWPFVLLLLDFWPLRRVGAGARDGGVSVRRAALEKVPLLLLCVVASALTLWAQAKGGAIRSVELVPLGARLANALVAYATYLGKLVWPADLAVLYPYPERPPVGEAVGAALLLAAVSVACLRLWRRRPYLLFGWLFYLGTLVPVIGLVQVGAQASADRYSYIPSIGLLVALVWAVGDAVAARPRLRPLAAGALLAALAALAALSARQVGFWRDSVTLYRHALAATGRNPVMTNNLGTALVDAGRVDEAIDVYAEGLAAPSQFSHILHYNAGIAFERAGRNSEALDAFDRVVAVEPTNAEALYHRGRVLRALNRHDEAMRDLARAVDLAPGEAEPRIELGLALGQRGRPAEARLQFERAVALEPYSVDARINLAIALIKTGDPDGAVLELSRVLDQHPGHPAALRYLAKARELARSAAAATKGQGDPR